MRTVDYPLTLPLYLDAARPPPAPEVAREFLAIHRHARGACWRCDEAGFVDQFLGTIPIEAQGERLAHAIEAAREPGAQADLRRVPSSASKGRRG